MSDKAPARDQRPVKFVSLPLMVARRLEQFLVDGRSGNVQLNIRDGQILGLTVEEKLSV